MPERTLSVRIIGDERSLARAFRSSSKEAARFEGRLAGVSSGISNLKRGFAAAGGTVGAALVIQKANEAKNAAVDLNEQTAKSRQVFARSSAAVEAWSRTTARAIGIARGAALTATGTFGNLFRAVRVAPAEAASMSQALVQLAADLASFNNAMPGDVLQALESGLIGEAEPLRRYGVLLSEARVQQEAMAATGKRNVKALTDQDKALARFAIIMRDTRLAQGDFARTSDELANKSRIVRARLNDLSANVGTVLVPVLNDAADAANLLFTALDKLRGVDFAPGFDFPDLPKELSAAALIPVSPLAAAAVTAKRIKDAFTGSAKEIEKATRPDDLAGPRGPGGIAAENVRLALEERDRQLAEAAAMLTRSRKRFAAFTKGIGLKLDKAGLTATLDDDLAALRALDRAIERQIGREGRTFALVEQLTQVRRQVADTIAERARAQAARSQESFRRVLDSLDLQLERAVGTARFDDDLRALRQIETAITRRIAAEGRTLELERQLLDVRRQQAETRQRQRQGRQFQALGLDAEGGERIASARALSGRLGTLRDRVKGTFLDTGKTRSELQRIGRVLSGDFGKVGRDVRSAIDRMLDDIQGALRGDGPHRRTKFRVVKTADLVKGLGLDPDEQRKVRQQFARLGPGGTMPGAGGGLGGAFGMAVPAGGGGSDRPIHVHLDLDGRQIADVVIREAQKRSRRMSGKRSGTRTGGRGL